MRIKPGIKICKQVRRFEKVSMLLLSLSKFMRNSMDTLPRDLRSLQ